MKWVSLQPVIQHKLQYTCCRDGCQTAHRVPLLLFQHDQYSQQSRS